MPCATTGSSSGGSASGLGQTIASGRLLGAAGAVATSLASEATTHFNWLPSGKSQAIDSSSSECSARSLRAARG